MWTGLMPSTLQSCRCGRFRGRNLAESVAVRRRFRAGVGVFWQTLASACQEMYIYLNPKNKWQFKIAKNFHVR